MPNFDSDFELIMNMLDTFILIIIPTYVAPLTYGILFHSSCVSLILLKFPQTFKNASL